MRGILLRCMSPFLALSGHSATCFHRSASVTPGFGLSSFEFGACKMHSSDD